MNKETTRILDKGYEAMITDPAYLRELSTDLARAGPGDTHRVLRGLALHFEQRRENPGEAVTVEDPGPVEHLEAEVERLLKIIAAKDKAMEVLQKERERLAQALGIPEAIADWRRIHDETRGLKATVESLQKDRPLPTCPGCGKITAGGTRCLDCAEMGI